MITLKLLIDSWSFILIFQDLGFAASLVITLTCMYCLHLARNF